MEFGNREGGDEVRTHLRGDDELAVRFALSRRELGEELVVGDACRSGQASLLQDARAYFRRDAGRGWQSSPVLGYVEIGLIECQRFNERGIIGKDLPDLV